MVGTGMSSQEPCPKPGPALPHMVFEDPSSLPTEALPTSCAAIPVLSRR